MRYLVRPVIARPPTRTPLALATGLAISLAGVGALVPGCTGGIDGGPVNSAVEVGASRFPRLTHEQWRNATRDLLRLDATPTNVLNEGQTTGLFGNVGFDLSERRIETARHAAAELGLTNATFEVGDARKISSLEPFDAIYMLDVLHHIPTDVVPALLESIHSALPPGGILVVKELDTSPTWQRVFAHVLDLAMSPSSPPHYWPQQKLAHTLEGAGFEVKRHALIDYLPYPHVLFIATKRS